jgi:hypothetical protein
MLQHLTFPKALLYLAAALVLLYLDKTSPWFRAQFQPTLPINFHFARVPGLDALVDNNNLYEHGVLQQIRHKHEAKHDNIRFEQLKFQFHKMKQHGRYVAEQHPEYLAYPHVEDVIIFIINGN